MQWEVRVAHEKFGESRTRFQIVVAVRDSSSRSPTVSIPVKIPGRDIDCVQLSVGRWALTISRGPGILEQSECERKALKRSPGVKP